MSVYPIKYNSNKLPYITPHDEVEVFSGDGYYLINNPFGKYEAEKENLFKILIAVLDDYK